jgi:hypothetical protein
LQRGLLLLQREQQLQLLGQFLAAFAKFSTTAHATAQARSAEAEMLVPLSRGQS